MGKKLFVGNLAFSATENSVHELFSQHGVVETCRLVTDRDTGRSKGFAFVEMSSEDEANDAISSLEGREMDGRALRVSEAKPQVERSSGYGASSRGGFSQRREGGGYSDRGNRRSY